MRAILPIALLALCACKPPPPPSPPPAPPPPGPVAAPVRISDFSQDITAVGAEPFWNLTIKGMTLVLAGPVQKDQIFTAPGATIRPGQAAWTAKGADGKTLEATIFMSDCSDGMSDRRYPMTAEVVVGDQTLHGCAFSKTAAATGAG